MANLHRGIRKRARSRKTDLDELAPSERRRVDSDELVAKCGLVVGGLGAGEKSLKSFFEESSSLLGCLFVDLRTSRQDLSQTSIVEERTFSASRYTIPIAEPGRTSWNWLRRTEANISNAHLPPNTS